MRGGAPRGGEANGQNWNIRFGISNRINFKFVISDAEAAGLIDGEDLNASQEGRCVVCG